VRCGHDAQAHRRTAVHTSSRSPILTFIIASYAAFAALASALPFFSRCSGRDEEVSLS